jgi:hypothetical protein
MRLRGCAIFIRTASNLRACHERVRGSICDWVGADAQFVFARVSGAAPKSISRPLFRDFFRDFLAPQPNTLTAIRLLQAAIEPGRRKAAKAAEVPTREATMAAFAKSWRRE